MSQIWPDIPEFDGVPEVLRSGLCMKAYTAALARRTTWLLGVLCLFACAGLGGVLGHQAFGTAGAVVGALLGTPIALALFVRVILERQARRLVPAVRAAAGWPNGAVRRSGDGSAAGSGATASSAQEPPRPI